MGTGLVRSAGQRQACPDRAGGRTASG